MSKQTTEVRDISLDGLVRGGAEHSDRPETVSKRSPGDTVTALMLPPRVPVRLTARCFARQSNRQLRRASRLPIAQTFPRRAMNRRRVALVACGILAWSWPANARPPAGVDSTPFVSAQAYHHALRAEFALARDDGATAHDELQLALVYDPSSVHLHAKLIRLMLMQRDLAAAAKYVRRARASAGDTVTVLRLASEVARAEGALARAERRLRTALQKAPHNLDVGLDLASILAMRNKRRRAFALLRQLSRRHRDSPRPHLVRADLLRSMGRWTLSSSALSAAARRSPLSIESVGHLADSYERSGRLGDAAAVLARACRRAPNDAQVRLYAARVALARDRPKEAARWLDDAKRCDPEAPVGLVLLAEGFDRESVNSLRAASVSSPADLAVRFGLGSALARTGRTDEALGHLGRIPPEATLYVSARLLMAEILMRQGRHQRAELALDVALKAHPTSARLLERQTELLVRQNRFEIAREALHRARDGSPTNPALWSTELKWLVRESGSRAQALLAAAKRVLPRSSVLRLEAEHALQQPRGSTSERTWRAVRQWCDAAPRNVDALLAMARVRLARGQPAKKWALKARGEQPRDPRVLSVLGWALHREGDHTKALEHLRRAVRLDPWDAEAAERWGDVARATGRREEARQAYSVAQEALQADLRSLRTESAAGLRRLKRKQGRLRRPE